MAIELSKPGADKKVFVDPQAVGMLLEAIKFDLPEEFRSPQGMAIFFKQLGELFHHFLHGARQVPLLDKVRAANMRLHKNSGYTLFLGALIELTAMRAGMPLEDKAHAAETARYHSDAGLFLTQFNTPALIAENRKNAATFQEIATFLCKNDLIMTPEEITALVGQSAQTIFKHYIAFLELIRKDGGKGITKLLGKAAVSLDAHPILCRTIHQAQALPHKSSRGSNKGR